MPRRLLRLADRPFDDYQRLILQKYVEMSKLQVEEAFKDLRNKRRNMLQSVPTDWKTPLMNYCYRRLRSECRRLSAKLRRKLRNLIEHSDWTKDANHEFVVNLSNRSLQSDAVSALGYGISFSISNRNINFVDVANSFYNLERYGDLLSEDISICKGIVYGSMSKPNYCNVPLRFIKAYKDLKNDASLHITKADK